MANGPPATVYGVPANASTNGPLRDELAPTEELLARLLETVMLDEACPRDDDEGALVAPTLLEGGRDDELERPAELEGGRLELLAREDDARDDDDTSPEELARDDEETRLDDAREDDTAREALELREDDEPLREELLGSAEDEEEPREEPRDDAMEDEADTPEVATKEEPRLDEPRLETPRDEEDSCEVAKLLEATPPPLELEPSTLMHAPRSQPNPGGHSEDVVQAGTQTLSRSVSSGPQTLVVQPQKRLTAQITAGRRNRNTLWTVSDAPRAHTLLPCAGVGP